MYNLILVLHILAATIWTGGHLFLVLGLLPKVLKTNDYQMLLDFERVYERVGIPALLIQVVSGFYLAYRLVPDISRWFSFSDHLSIHVGVKLLLLLGTICLALVANFVIIPNLSKGNNLKIMSVLAFIVTIFAVLFVVVGVSFRLFIF